MSSNIINYVGKNKKRKFNSLGLGPVFVFHRFFINSILNLCFLSDRSFMFGPQVHERGHKIVLKFLHSCSGQ